MCLHLVRRDHGQAVAAYAARLAVAALERDGGQAQFIRHEPPVCTSSLAPLLDHRRYVESVVAGITVPAHPEFRCAVTMNQDDSTYEIPDYILSRLQPTLKLGFPSRRETTSTTGVFGHNKRFKN